MDNLINIADLLEFLVQNELWQRTLLNGTSFYSFEDIHNELLSDNNNYDRYFRIYINIPNNSIMVHRIYCPDQKLNPSGVIEPRNSGVWLGYFRVPNNENPEEYINRLLNVLIENLNFLRNMNFGFCNRCWENN